jgi:hypothetical protein
MGRRRYPLPRPLVLYRRGRYDIAMDTSPGDIPSPTLLANIRAEMARQSMTQRQLGKRIRLGQAAISTRLTGRVRLTVWELELIAKALGTTTAALMDCASDE